MGYPVANDLLRSRPGAVDGVQFRIPVEITVIERQFVLKTIKRQK